MTGPRVNRTRRCSMCEDGRRHMGLPPQQDPPPRVKLGPETPAIHQVALCPSHDLVGSTTDYPPKIRAAMGLRVLPFQDGTPE